MARRRFRIGILISCLTLAVILWGFVTLTRMYEDDVFVPLTVLAPPNQALLSTVPTEISVHVRATGLQILNLKYLNRNTFCTVDLSKLNASSQGVFTIDREHFVRGISTPEPIRILSIFPASLTMATGDLYIKTVPIRLRTNIATRDGFSIVGSAVAEPATVEVRGTKSVVEGIQSWPTKRISLEDLHESTFEFVDMSDSLTTLLNVVPPRVRVSVNVQQQATVEIPDVPVHNEAERPTYLMPSRMTVTVSGGIEELASVTANDVTVTIPKNQTGFVRPTIIVPPTMQVVGSQPSWVRVISMASP